jgi:hypothetical protein
MGGSLSPMILCGPSRTLALTLNPQPKAGNKQAPESWSWSSALELSTTSVCLVSEDSVKASVQIDPSQGSRS